MTAFECPSHPWLRRSQVASEYQILLDPIFITINSILAAAPRVLLCQVLKKERTKGLVLLYWFYNLISWTQIFNSEYLTWQGPAGIPSCVQQFSTYWSCLGLYIPKCLCASSPYFQSHGGQAGILKSNEQCAYTGEQLSLVGVGNWDGSMAVGD